PRPTPPRDQPARSRDGPPARVGYPPAVASVPLPRGPLDGLPDGLPGDPLSAPLPATPTPAVTVSRSTLSTLLATDPGAPRVPRTPAPARRSRHGPDRSSPGLPIAATPREPPFRRPRASAEPTAAPTSTIRPSRCAPASLRRPRRASCKGGCGGTIPPRRAPPGACPVHPLAAVPSSSAARWPPHTCRPVPPRTVIPGAADTRTRPAAPACRRAAP